MADKVLCYLLDCVVFFYFKNKNKPKIKEPSQTMQDEERLLIEVEHLQVILKINYLISSRCL